MRARPREITIGVLLIVLPVCVVLSTGRTFNATMDEPIHIAAGFEWLATGDCSFDIEHPPLACIVGALPLWLEGLKLPSARWAARGDELLQEGGRYLDHLQLARSGMVIFLILMLVTIWVWTRRMLSPAHALWAVFLLGTLPPVLAHANFVATDIPGAAMLPLALYALEVYLHDPSWRKTVFLGLAMGVGAAVKYSFLVFFPPCAAMLIAAFLWRNRASLPRAREHARRVVVALGIAGLVIWAVFRFDVGTMADAHPRGRELVFLGLRGGPLYLLQPLADAMPIPAPLFADGVLEVKLHNERGHHSRFEGVTRQLGVWYYFPTVLFLKTPLAFLALTLVGAVTMRSRPELALLPLGVLLPAMTSRINIGVRHIMPIYPLLAILAAHGVLTLWRARSVAGKTFLMILLPWNVFSTVSAYPDYLAWFNEAAGAHPENIVVDSDNDWGQDVLRLVDYCDQHRIRSLGEAVFVSCDLSKFRLPPRHPINARTRGWIAVSEMMYWGLFPGCDYRYLDPYYVGRVGNSIRMFYVPQRVRTLAARPGCG